MPKTSNISETVFKKRLFDKFGDEYQLINDYYLYTEGEALFIHNGCHKTFRWIPSRLMLKKIPCPYCNPYTRKTTEQFSEEYYKIVKHEYYVSGEYVSANDFIEVTHSICGTPFKALPSNLLKGTSKCPYCNKTTRNKPKYVIDRLIRDICGDEYTLLNEEDIIHKSTPIKMRHNSCGLPYDFPIGTSISDFLYKNGCRCPRCERKVHLNQESYEARVREKYGNEYSVVSTFSTTNDVIWIYHNFCKKKFDVIAEDFISGRKLCPYCSNHGGSFPEKYVQCMLDLCGVKYIKQFSVKHAKWVGKYRYDFYLPDHSMIVEVNGLQHYNDAWDSYKDISSNDIAKKELAINNGIKNYICIDARFSSSTYIQNSIKHSELQNILDLRNIDWEKCFLNALRTDKVDIIESWNEGLSVKQLMEKYQRSDSYIYRILNEADKENVLTRNLKNAYKENRKQSSFGKNSGTNKPVRCVETGELFISAAEAERKYDPKIHEKAKPNENIAACARKGKEKHTAYGYHWEYVT